MLMERLDWMVLEVFANAKDLLIQGRSRGARGARSAPSRGPGEGLRPLSPKADHGPNLRENVLQLFFRGLIRDVPHCGDRRSRRSARRVPAPTARGGHPPASPALPVPAPFPLQVAVPPRGLTEHRTQGTIHGGVPHRQPRHRTAPAASGPCANRPPASASASARARSRHGSCAPRKRSGGKRGTGGSGAGVPGLAGTPERGAAASGIPRHRQPASGQPRGIRDALPGTGAEAQLLTPPGVR